MLVIVKHITLQRNIEVRWRAPERPNGQIIGYKIVHTPPGTNFTVGPDTLSYNIRDLGECETLCYFFVILIYWVTYRCRRNTDEIYCLELYKITTLHPQNPGRNTT